MLFLEVQVHHPLQQGLRPINRLRLTQLLQMVQVHHPLQQGLRQTHFVCYFLQSSVQVHHPLQQGLRRTLCASWPKFFCRTSASSITTRIKTIFSEPLPYI